MSRFVIHADGACSGNPGPGGWAFEINGQDYRFSGSGKVPDTTNNRMELEAATQGVKSVFSEGINAEEILIVTDSAYVVDGYNQWLAGWKKNGWRTSARKPVANSDLWISLDDAVSSLVARGVKVGFRWVKGHEKDPVNHRVDVAAYNASQSLRAEGDNPKAPSEAPKTTQDNEIFHNPEGAKTRKIIRVILGSGDQ